MRKIEFRCWDTIKEKHRLVEKLYFSVVGEIQGVAVESDMDEDYRFYIPKEEFVLEQNTEIKDKNGKYIFEGDIFKKELLRRHPTDTSGGSFWVPCTLKVVYKDGAFIGEVISSKKYFDFKENHCVGYFIDNIKNIEIIGNIHEEIF